LLLMLLQELVDRSVRVTVLTPPVGTNQDPKKSLWARKRDEVDDLFPVTFDLGGISVVRKLPRTKMPDRATFSELHSTLTPLLETMEDPLIWLQDVGWEWEVVAELVRQRPGLRCCWRCDTSDFPSDLAAADWLDQALISRPALSEQLTAAGFPGEVRYFPNGLQRLDEWATLVEPPANFQDMLTERMVSGMLPPAAPAPSQPDLGSLRLEIGRLGTNFWLGDFPPVVAVVEDWRSREAFPWVEHTMQRVRREYPTAKLWLISREHVKKTPPFTGTVEAFTTTSATEFLAVASVILHPPNGSGDLSPLDETQQVAVPKVIAESEAAHDLLEGRSLATNWARSEAQMVKLALAAIELGKSGEAVRASWDQWQDFAEKKMTTLASMADALLW